jgi:hypothetical protein
MPGCSRVESLFREGEPTMSELVTKSVAQEQQQPEIETRTAVQRITGFTLVATAIAVLAVLLAAVVYAEDKILIEITERNRVLRLQRI